MWSSRVCSCSTALFEPVRSTRGQNCREPAVTDVASGENVGGGKFTAYRAVAAWLDGLGDSRVGVPTFVSGAGPRVPVS